MMGGFSALLVGVPRYQDHRIPNLPFIENDLVELGKALKANGWEIERPEYDGTGRSPIKYSIDEFIKRAPAGQTLLVYLSGHGFNYEGSDYLLVHDSITNADDLPDMCVAIDFERVVDKSPAGNVLVAVDACREGIDWLHKGVWGPWSNRKIQRVGNRTFAYMYACSKGETAGYVRDDSGRGFSLFTRAFSTVLARPDGPATLAGIEESLRAEVDQLVSNHKQRSQNVHVLTEATEADKKTFVLSDRYSKAGRSVDEHPWVVAVREHAGWTYCTDDTTVEVLRPATVELVRRLNHQWKQDFELVRDDPWVDDEFAERMCDRMGLLLQLIGKSNRDPLSASETAFLIALPFVHAAYWIRQLAAARQVVDPLGLIGKATSVEQRSFQRVADRFGLLVRRANRAAAGKDNTIVAGIAWWLFHHWLGRQPLAYQDDQLGALVGAWPDRANRLEQRLLTETFEASRFIQALRSLRSDVSYLSRMDLEAGPVFRLSVAVATPFESSMCQRRLACLANVAYYLGIDPIALPEVVVEHVGISDPVSLDALRSTLRDADWERRGRTRVLYARCDHAAVDFALRSHAQVTDDLLRAISSADSNDADLAPLKALPTHATADNVEARQYEDGTRAYDWGGFRFRLADDRVQDLLMGEQLYGDPALAVRELYQNALDACRYREARSRYLQATGSQQPEPDWRGQISFRMGVDDDGRSYLSCIDNGIGMEVRELKGAFSQAGIRFSDLPGYVEEQADWEHARIEFFPNSRFGIGALSYFMLADDITVITCRLDRLGRPGHKIEAHVAGPGALFRVHDHGPGTESDVGTEVRLHLRSDDASVSPVDLLRRILWVSDYDVEATDATGSLKLTARQLSRDAPIGAEDPLVRDAHRTVNRVDTTTSPDIWWCDSRGGILADGLWAGATSYGVVVNLTGRHMPRLTVDRKTLLDWDRDDVQRRLEQEIDSLLGSESSVLSHEWLCALAPHHPSLADKIFERAAAIGYRPWRVAGHSKDIAAVGCFGFDAQLFRSPHKDIWPDPYDFRTVKLPDQVVTWRQQAWAVGSHALPPGDGYQATDGASIAGPGVVLARPTDYLLLDPTRDKRDVSQPFPLGALVAAAVATGRSPEAVAERLRTFGLATADVRGLTEPPQPDDPIILSYHLDGKGSWLDTDDFVSHGHLVAACVVTGRSSVDVGGRLRVLGLKTADASSFPEPLGRDDTMILSQDCKGEGWWLDEDKPVRQRHLLHASLVTGWSPAEIAARLRALGLETADASSLREPLSRDDAIVLSADFEGERFETVFEEEAVPFGHIVAAALKTNRSPTDIAARLQTLGLTTADTMVSSESPQSDDVIILSYDLDGEGSWLDSDKAVPSGHVVAAALKTNRSPTDIAARLRVLGFETADASSFPEPLGRDDAAILSRMSRWLWWPGDRIVPLGYLVAAAFDTGRSPADIASRLRTFGFQVADVPESAEYQHDDRLILDRDLDGQGFWLDSDKAVPPGHIVAAALKTNRSPADVAARLRALGFETADASALPEPARPEDVMILNERLHRSSLYSWLDFKEAVPLGHLIRAAIRTETTPQDIASRLRSFGFTTADASTLPEPARSEDLVILSQYLSGEDPWLQPDETVPPGHLLAAAVAKARNPAEISARLQALGLRTVHSPTLAEPVHAEDLVILSQSLANRGPWLAADETVPPGHLVAAALAIERTPPDVAGRLQAFGLRTVDAPALTEPPQSEDLIVLSRRLNGRHPWLAADETVPPGHVVAVALETGCTPGEVAARLNAFGLTTVDITGAVGPFDKDDPIILSENVYRRGPWLEPDETVPTEHLQAAADETGRSVADVAARLRAFGFTVEE